LTLTRQLAAFAAGVAYDDLPAGVVVLAKQLILDTLGTALAATTLGAGCREVVDVMTALGGTPESAIIGHGVRVAAPNAALANGTLAHALNYDAIGKETGHIGAVAVTAPLALADARAPVSGRRLIEAVVAAAEVTARVTLGAVRGGDNVSKRILSGQFFGYFGAAAGAGRILGLSAATMHSAFGLALMQLSGSRQVVIGGDPPAKAIYAAFPNHGGVLAALLAAAGLEAEIDALDGVAGIYGLAADGSFDPAALTEGLGEQFAFVNAQFKPWPTSGNVAPFIEAAIELATREDLEPDDIEAVELTGSERYRDWFEPLNERRRPPNPAAAANSTPFAVGKALAHREVVLADFTADGLGDVQALALADRTTHRLDGRAGGGVVVVLTTDGRRFEAAVEKPLGDPSRPMSQAQLEAKFRDCARYATGFSPADADAVIALIDRLEDAADVTGLTSPAVAR
jgi:2-methylcitrate dehydratase PrpD